MSGYLETKNLSVGYHGKPLIEDVSLCVQRGKIVTLIGPNGSGKSTILKPSSVSCRSFPAQCIWMARRCARAAEMISHAAWRS